MASERLLFLAVVLTLLLVSHAQTDSDTVTLFKMESRSSIDVGTVTLQCSVGTNVQGNRTFNREVNGMIEGVTDATENAQIITFKLLPSKEGNYFCQVGNVASNKILVLAYPVLNRRITSTRLPPVGLGGTIRVPCAYERGRINDRHQEVAWFRGMDRVVTTISQFDRYTILSNFSLVIRDVKSSDASNAYYCQVNVTTYNETVVKAAPFISVNVLGPIEVTQPIQEQIVTPNRMATFLCKISGVPKPTIKWLFNGHELVNSSAHRLTQYRNELRSVLTVTSQMEISTSLGSGRVACVGYHVGEEGMVVVSSEANLVVLTDKLVPELEQSQEGAMLSVQFPSVIPGQFDIEVYYKHQDKSSRRLISHPTFRNTREVNIAIPQDKLPNFRTFTVRVALSVANMTGEASIESNQITIDEYPPIISNQDCSCPNAEGVRPAGSNSTTIGVLAAFIVILIIAIIVMIILSVLVFVCCKRMKDYTVNKDLNRYDNDGHFSSEDHVSKTSNSYVDVSASGNRSPPHNRLRKGSYSSREAGGETSEEEEEAGDNRSHKKLQQWDDNTKAVGVDEPVKVDETNMDDTTVDDETGIRVPSKDFATCIPAPRTRKRVELPYVTNPALMLRARENNNTKMKPSDSTSSFEDLQDECNEFTTEAPRTM